jgi:hypothetical protein
MIHDPSKKIVDLPPDDIERFVGSHIVLSDCPFCSGHPFLHTRQNTISGNFIAIMSCSKCMANVFVCQGDRKTAQKDALVAWQTRVDEDPVELPEVLMSRLS